MAWEQAAGAVASGLGSAFASAPTLLPASSGNAPVVFGDSPGGDINFYGGTAPDGPFIDNFIPSNLENDQLARILVGGSAVVLFVILAGKAIKKVRK